MAQTCDAGDLTSSVTAAPCHLPQRGRLIWFGQAFSHRKSNFTANTRQSYSAACFLVLPRAFQFCETLAFFAGFLYNIYKAHLRR